MFLSGWTETTMTLEKWGWHDVCVHALQSPHRTWLAVSKPSSGISPGQSVHTRWIINYYAFQCCINFTDADLLSQNFQVFQIVWWLGSIWTHYQKSLMSNTSTASVMLHLDFDQHWNKNDILVSQNESKGKSPSTGFSWCHHTCVNIWQGTV